MDEAMLKSGQYPNVAIEAGTDPAEVMRKQVEDAMMDAELKDMEARCGGAIEWCMEHGDSLSEALLHADEICRAEQADSREKLEADARQFAWDYLFGDDYDVLEAELMGLLDRQAKISERELCGRCSPYATTKDYLDTIDSLTAECDELKAKLETYGKVPDQGEREELPPVESGDTREKLEADIRAWHRDTPFATKPSVQTLLGWLDRQAAITERECMSRDTSERVGWDCAECAEGLGKELDARCDKLKERIAELEAERDELTADAKRWADAANAQRLVAMEQADLVRDLTAERDQLQTERDMLQGANDFLADGFKGIQAERGKLEKELKQARIEWESERDYADQCEERLMELTGETDREENGMTKKQLKKDYKRLLKQIDELDERIDKERLDTEDYRLMRAMYFAMCAIEGLLRHRIETM